MNPSYGKHLLHKAIKTKREAIVDLLLSHGVDVNIRNHADLTPLHIASMESHFSIAEKLVNRGANVNSKICANQSNPGYTPLHYAIAGCNLEITELLLKNNAYIDAERSDGMTPISMAAEKGNFKLVKILVNNGANVNPLSGVHPLHIAIRKNKQDIVDFLLDNEAQVNARDTKDLTPLHMACREGNLAIVEKLLKRGACVNSIVCNGRYSGYAPLHFAIKSGNNEITELLLKNDASLDVKTRNGWNPISLAVDTENIKVVEMLIEREVDLNPVFGKHPLHVAIKNNNIAVVDYLLYEEAAIHAKDHKDQTPLHVASARGNLIIADKLLNKRACVNATISNTYHNAGYTPLHFAVEQGNIHMTALLLDNNASVEAQTKKGWTPLRMAAKNGQVKIAKMLIDKGAKINPTTGKLPLHDAINSNHQKMVDLLVKRGAAVNVRGHKNMSALDTACREGHYVIAKKLISKGAYVNPALFNDSFYSEPTPLHYAAKSGNEKIMELLLDNEAWIDATTRRNWTPLCTAAKKGRVKIIEMLVNCGANINPTGGRRPLNVAVESGKKEAVDFLLRRGARVNDRDIEGYTPLHVASMLGRLAIAEELINSGACVHSSIRETTNRSGYQPLHLAIEAGSEGIVKLLLDNNVSVDAQTDDGWFPLNIAAKRANVEIIKMLLDKGANVRPLVGKNMLHIAIKSISRKRYDIVRLMLNAGANVNSIKESTTRDLVMNREYNTPILCAIENNDEAMIKILLDAGASVENNASLINIAAENANSKIIDILLGLERIDINLQDQNGNTALHALILPASKGQLNNDSERLQIARIEIAKTLLSRGSCIKILNHLDFTPLHMAAVSGYINMLQVLIDWHQNGLSPINSSFPHSDNFVNDQEGNMKLKKRFRIDFPNRQGKTPLHVAVRYNTWNTNTICSLLIDNGADIDAKDQYGLTPVDYAFQYYCKGSFRLLLTSGSDFSKLENIDSRHSCPELIRQHIILMRVGGRLISHKHLKFTENLDPIMRRYRDRCAKEIQDMAKEEHVNFQDIVKGNEKQLAMFVRNEHFLRAIETKSYREKFPTYAHWIDCQFKRGLARKNLLDLSVSHFEIIVENPLPPEILKFEIFGLLNQTDLENFIEACDGWM